MLLGNHDRHLSLQQLSRQQPCHSPEAVNLQADLTLSSTSMQDDLCDWQLSDVCVHSCSLNAAMHALASAAMPSTLNAAKHAIGNAGMHAAPM